MFGWMWYGSLFGEAWVAAEGAAQQLANARLEEMGMATWLVSALLLTLGQAVSVLMVIPFAGAKRLPASLKADFWLAVTMALPLLGYASVYGGYPWTGFGAYFDRLSTHGGPLCGGPR